jgi:hypothetical protein
MDTVLESVRTTILMAFRTFPLIIISFIAFLAVGLGNLGLFVLFVGHALMVPIAVAITQLLTDFIFKRQNMPSYLYEVEASHVALLVPTGTYANTRVNVAPSYWMAQTLFLFGYLIANAVSILYIPTDSRLDPILISNRKSRAKTIIITSLFFAAVLTGLRYSTHTETPVGIVAAVLVGGFLGYGWYQVAAACGVAAADVFGVAQQMIPSGGNTDTPMTCVYAPKP